MKILKGLIIALGLFGGDLYAQTMQHELNRDPNNYEFGLLVLANQSRVVEASLFWSFCSHNSHYEKDSIWNL